MKFHFFHRSFPNPSSHWQLLDAQLRTGVACRGAEYQAPVDQLALGAMQDLVGGFELLVASFAIRSAARRVVSCSMCSMVCVVLGGVRFRGALELFCAAHLVTLAANHKGHLTVVCKGSFIHGKELMYKSKGGRSTRVDPGGGFCGAWRCSSVMFPTGAGGGRDASVITSSSSIPHGRHARFLLQQRPR